MGDERAFARKGFVDEVATDSQEDALNVRAERIDDVADERAYAIIEVAEEME